jgi:hypothetical protein
MERSGLVPGLADGGVEVVVAIVIALGVASEEAIHIYTSY